MEQRKVGKIMKDDELIPIFKICVDEHSELKINDEVKHINHLDWGIGIVTAFSTTPSTKKVYVKFNIIGMFPEKMCSIGNLIKHE